VYAAWISRLARDSMSMTVAFATTVERKSGTAVSPPFVVSVPGTTWLVEP
jgi:hypothetical protein